jgi:catechol 2,3-dioxygenase-like lactoylglutathione lyase family enzyme
MLSHVSLGVRDIKRAAEFYDAVLGAMGYVRLWTGQAGLGYGAGGGGEQLNIFQHQDTRPAGAGFHLAFTAPSPEAVDGFHAAALANGGVDLGVPGLRPHYGATYYAAFVADPDGHKLEAVNQ